MTGNNTGNWGRTGARAALDADAESRLSGCDDDGDLSVLEAGDPSAVLSGPSFWSIPSGAVKAVGGGRGGGEP